MPDAELTFITSGNFVRPADRWLEPVLRAWPAPRKPTKAARTLDAWMDDHRPAHDDASEMLAVPTGASLVVLDGNERASQVDRLVESLTDRHCPAVVLMERPDDWQLFQRRGIIFERWDADPGVLAAMLFALIERQQTVRLLAHEVQLAQRCQGGIRTEIDRLHEELHLAAAIQRDFTSSPVPTLAGLDIAVLFRPVNFVSGDVYNVRDLGDGRAAFFIADAVGHGVPAALLTMVLTSSLAASDDHGRAQPAEVMGRLNQRLIASCLGTGRFATAVYGVVDARSRRVALAGAGHPLPIILSGSASREVETCGPLLGIFDQAEFDQAEFELERDETLMLYTDGLDAAFFAGEKANLHQRRDQFIATIAKELGETGSARLPHLLTELQHRLDMLSGSLHGGDDVTAVCIAPAA